MSNLNTISPITANADFKVNTVTGEAFISQRKAAELTGIPRQTLQDWLKADREKALNENIQPLYKVNENNQLDAKSLQKLVLSGIGKGYEKCTELLEKLMEAGATAFIYHQAGIKLQPVIDPTLPQTHIDAVRAYLRTLEVVEAQSKQLGIQAEVIQHKQVITNDSEDWFPILEIKTLNPNMTFNGSRLTRESIEQGLEPQTLYSTYGVNSPNTYHRTVWNIVYPDAVLPN